MALARPGWRPVPVALRRALSRVRRDRAAAAAPGEQVFGALRLRLTLWYSAVLMLSFAVAGAALYLGLRQRLMDGAMAQVEEHARFQQTIWLQSASRLCRPPTGGPVPGPGPGPVGPGAGMGSGLPGGGSGPGAGGGVRGAGGRPPAPGAPAGGPAGGLLGTPPGGGRPPAPPISVPALVACVDRDGRVTEIGSEPRSLEDSFAGGLSDRFTQGTLISRAMKQGRVADFLAGVPEEGTMLRLAQPVRDPASGELLGGFLVAIPINDRLDMLAAVRTALLLLGGGAVLLAAGGGWLLANRALAPARLAFARQQAFIADASHELRTPMALLRANAEVLLRHRDRLPPDDTELLDDIVGETDHMDRLATSLLTLARLDAGKLHLEQEIVDLGRVAESLARRVGPLAAAKGVQVRNDCRDAALVVGDSEYIEQAALVLVENAVKYTPAGGTVALRTASVAAAAGQRAGAAGFAGLEVEDTGAGIPAEHLRHLGQRFYRADKSRHRQTGGAGIGLAIAFRIAAAHGGTVHLASAAGQGTRATLILPAVTTSA